MAHKCIKCGVPLIVGENIVQYNIDNYQYICRSCATKQEREILHRTGVYKPMSENKTCTAFLGIHVAERVLRHVFKDVEVMSNNNPGYDFICGGGYKIDVKSSCRHVRKDWADMWTFHIKKNQIAEYFLCLAFDNREDLNPEHIWLISSDKINDHVSVSISETTLARWDQYKLDINKVSACCNILRNKHQ